MRKNAEEIISGDYLIGGPAITSADDAAIYLIDFAGELVLIDGERAEVPPRLSAILKCSA